jgi:membrane fusion protein, multidrug efflux system
MSTPTPTAAPATMPPESVQTPAAAPSRRPLSRLLWLGGMVVLTGLAIFPAYPWWSYRVTHSITEDAFVEAHIVNVAPQAVSGHVVRFLVEENDRVKKGDILVHIDKEPFEVQVAIKKAAVEVAQANLIAARAQVRAQVAQTRAYRFKLEHAIEDVGNQTANLRAVVATLSSRRATLDLAESNLKRAEAAVASRAISKEEIDTRRQAVEVAQASVSQALEQIYGIRAYLGLPPPAPQGPRPE